MLKIRFIAKTPDELAKGLMHGSPLASDECAFFIFPQPCDPAFWNKNVDFPISLLYLDENFEVKHVGKLKANQEKSNRSNYPYIKYVIEGHELLPAEQNINKGDFCVPIEKNIKIIKGKQKKT